jgi:hypothetical protein
LVVSGQRPAPDAMAVLRRRYDTDQLTVLQNNA